MATLPGELRYALRTLRRTPAFTLIAALCLALGIGATTGIFTVVHAVVLKPLPYNEPERLVRLYSEFTNFPGGGLRKFPISGAEYLDLRRDLSSWQSLDAWIVTGANIAGAGEPVRVTAAAITGGLLPTLGVQPIHGRLITPSDDQPGVNRNAVISRGLWQRLFGGDPSAVGRTVQVNGAAATIVGVMPDGFTFPPGAADPPELWTPLQLDPARPGGRASHNFSVFGRLKQGISFEQAKQELTRYLEEQGRNTTPNYHNFDPKNHPLVSYSFHEEVVGAVRPALLMMLGAVGFVLLIACFNVANLLLARAESRQREVAVRRALGANLGVLVRQYLLEGLILSLAGAVFGVAIAWGGLRLVMASGYTGIPRMTEISLDLRVLLFTLAVSVGTTLLFGLAPLAQLRVKATVEALRAAAGRSTASVEAGRIRQTLVVAELALALVLLIGGGLMVRAFWKLQAVNIGVNPQNVLTLRIALPQGTYRDNDAVTQFWQRLRESAVRLPGVVEMTMANGIPPARILNANDTEFEGFVMRKDGPMQNVDYWNFVGPRYFEAMKVQLVEGRYFDERDGRTGAPAIIVNQTLAQTFWPGQSPLGRRVRPGFTDPWRIVVGVVADVKNAGADKPTGTELYFPIEQAPNPMRLGFLIVRAAGDPNALIGPLRAAVAEINPSVPVSQIRMLDDVIAADRARPRFLTMLLTLFSAIALSLAAIGIYGVISYSVAQRTNEFGVRMAIGAEPRHVLRLVMRQGAVMAAVGVGLGALGAVGLTRFLKNLLFGVDALDPLTFAAMAALLVAVMLGACFLPARRATRVDPIVALRYE
ncbi:MAG: ABC transporter permease [Bryobacteraceae bacterium]|nr:ABC transporter permease [Bryobacteraceae bacterium]